MAPQSMLTENPVTPNKVPPTRVESPCNDERTGRSMDLRLAASHSSEQESAPPQTCWRNVTREHYPAVHRSDVDVTREGRAQVVSDDCDAATVETITRNSVLQLPQFQPSFEDHAGELHRRISRMPAISNSYLLATWQKEWCVVSHNFLVFFASKTNLTVNKCVLLSSIQSVESLNDGRSFRINLDDKTPDHHEELVLKVPKCHDVLVGSSDHRKEELQQWIQEVQRRVQVLRQCGRRLLPCISCDEAHRLIEEFQRELNDAKHSRDNAIEMDLRSSKQKALLVMLRSMFSAAIYRCQRDAFDELALHSRLTAVHQLRRRAATHRLLHSLQRPKLRMLHTNILHWARNCSSAQAVFQVEQQRCRRKRICLAVGVVWALLREWDRALMQAAVTQLHKHASDFSSLETSALTANAGTGLPFSFPVQACRHVPVHTQSEESIAAVSQRLVIGGHVLKLALRHSVASSCEWALHTWSIFAARSMETEADKLARDAEALNLQFASRCARASRDTICIMILAIQSAQMRQTLSSFIALSMVSKVKCTGKKEGQGEKCNPLPRFGGPSLPPVPHRAACATDGARITPQKVASGELCLTAARHDLNFSPSPMSPLTESTDAPT